MTPRKTASLSIRITEELKRALEKGAARDGQRVGNLVTKILTDWLRKTERRAS